MNEVRILTYLAGVREFLAGARAEAAALAELGLATKGLGYEMATTTKRSWLMNQSLFTLRRLTYGVTLGLIAGGVAALKWGNDYNKAIQGARVALGPFFSDSQDLERNLNQLWTIAKYSPFQIQDMTLAFGKMAPALMQLGMTGDDVTRILKDLTDALSVGMAGRVTPMALNRASVALQHLAFLGRLTGMSVLQLARDGVPIYAALSKELGLTADQMHNIGKMNIPASTALQAIQKYIETTPGYANAALRVSQQSVGGLLSQLRDNISKTMGLAEKNWFKHLQRMLVGANNWFNLLQKNINKTGDFIQALDMTITPHSHGIEKAWYLISNIFRNVWIIFSAIVTTVMQSKAVWTTLFLVLGGIWLATSGIAHSTAVWVPLLKILIPLLIAHYIWTKGIAFYETLYWTAVRLSILWDFRKAAILRIITGLQRLYIILTAGSIAASNGQFIALSRLEKIVFKLRYAFLSLLASMEANPIILIATLIIVVIAGLVILYFKWKAFHDLVNRTARWLYAHYAILAFIPIFGPMIVGIILVIKHFKTLVHWVRTLVHWISRIHMPHIHIPGAGIFGHIPGLQGGGSVVNQGSVLVGERGPEVLSLPRGASVVPINPVFHMGGRAGNITIPITLKVDGRVLAEIVAKHQTSVNARA